MIWLFLFAWMFLVGIICVANISADRQTGKFYRPNIFTMIILAISICLFPIFTVVWIMALSCDNHKLVKLLNEETDEC